MKTRTLDHPLSAFPIVSTSDPEEARPVLSRELEKNLRFGKVCGSQSFRFEMNGVHLGRTLVAYNWFATETIVEAGAVAESVVYVIGTGSPCTFTLDGERLNCADRAVVVSPGCRMHIERSPGSGVLLVRASLDTISARFGEAVGRPPRGRLVFDTSLERGHPVDLHARQLLSIIVNDARLDGGLETNAVLRAGMDDALLSVLVALPSNHSEALTGCRGPAAGVAIVQRAEEFMAAHAAEAISITDVVAQCACSRRALFDTFSRYREYTPMQFLKQRRLWSAYLALSVPRPGQSVASIAHAHGFVHLGRFAAAYQQCFGRSPSQTLRQARGMIHA